MELKIYRHKKYKDIYLIRNWSVCGGCEDTEFYITTKSLKSAVDNMFRYNSETKNDELATDFMHWAESFNNQLKVKILYEKEVDFDGYKGKLKKEEIVSISDFEPVILVEKV